MNYLAHIFLAGDDPQWQMGSLLGDYIKGPLTGTYPPTIEAGIRLHRAVDVKTDSLHTVKQAARLFDPPFKRYGGILVDMCFDHFLATHWQQFHSEPLDAFCEQFYHHFAQLPFPVPPRAQRFQKVAANTRWLQSYTEFNRLEYMLDVVGQRFRRPVPLAEAFPQLKQLRPMLEQAFFATMPELIEFAAAKRIELTAQTLG